MKHIRRLPAFLLCIALTATSSTALAAKDKAFTEKPTLKINLPSSMESYKSEEYTVTASLPGFMTVTLLDASGSEVMTLLDHQEIHSKMNVLDFLARTPEGEALPAGDYTFKLSMVSQYGVASDEITAGIKLEPSTYVPRDEEEPEEAADAPADDAQVSADEPENTQKQPAATKAPASAKPAATPIPTDSAYAAGSFKTGDEGLMIGVGVSDIAMQTDSGYWGLTADASDEDIWAALTRPLVSVDVSEQESAYIYDTTEDGRKKLGSISGLSQGVNVVAKREDGWSLVEAFRNEDGAFIRGYIRSNKLRTVEVNQTYGMVIDKNTQTLTVYKDGERLGSCQVSTGLPAKKYLHRETPAGEFMTVTRRGTIEYYGKGFTKYTIRLNGSYYLCEIPTTKKNGSTFLDEVRDQLGNKATRGNICVAHEASSDGGINAEWIWNMTDDNKKVKVLIFDDKARTDVPVGE